MTASQINIVVGTNEWKSAIYYYDVKDIIVHERYHRSNYNNDIALIRIKFPIEFNEQVQPIKYTANEVAPGTPLQTTGWGALIVIAFNFIVVEKNLS